MDEDNEQSETQDEAEKVYVGLRVPKEELEDFKRATGTDTASAALLSAARKGLNFIRKTESVLLSGIATQGV